MKKKIVVAILPLGNVPAAELDFAKNTIERTMGLHTKLLPEAVIPTSYFDRSRGQWDADRLLEMLFDMLPDDCERIIGVLASDMYAAGRTFVFGYAHLRDGVAVYSIARLREEWYGRKEDVEKQQSRSYRCIVHELGHTFGNPHCENHCVMHAVSQVDSLDALCRDYCPACARRVQRGKYVTINTAEGQFQRAGALLRRRYLPQSVAMYRKATESYPHEPRYHNDLGVALLAMSDRPAAKAAFMRASDLSAGFPHPYYNLGILCRDEGGVEAAEIWFEKGLKCDPDPLAAHRYLARLYDELFNDKARASKHYEEYIKLDGNEWDVLRRAEQLRESQQQKAASASGDEK